MLVVEIQIDSPFLRETLTRVPEATISLEDLYRTEDSGIVHFWVEGGDLATLEDALASDRTVTNVGQIVETETQSLYRVTCSDYGRHVVTFPSWGELDIGFLDATASHEGWEVRLRMPDRAALRAYREVCAEKGLGFQLSSIYEEQEAVTMSDAQLTASQREALLAAHELGYFEVPRHASLGDVAAQFDISPQAVSERLRRGAATLIETSLLDRTA